MTDPLLEDHFREEFNRWAEAGRGEVMEQQHLPIVEPMLALIEFNPQDKVLDVGCGTGWLAHRIAPLVSAGLAAGMDVSNAMVRRAEALSAELPNVVFARGGVDAIPWDSGFFTKVLSVESAYYWPDPANRLAKARGERKRDFTAPAARRGELGSAGAARQHSAVAWHAPLSVLLP
jgi:SAM-dependent methyltransferase